MGGAKKRFSRPVHIAAASGDGEERFPNMSTCASPFRDAVTSNACCLDNWISLLSVRHHSRNVPTGSVANGGRIR